MLEVLASHFLRATGRQTVETSEIKILD